MIKSNYFEDNHDLNQHIDQIINWKELIDNYENGFKDAARYKQTGDERYAYAPSSYEEALEYYKTILNNYGDLMGNEVSQIAREVDQEGLKFEDGVVTHPQKMADLVRKFHDAGIVATSFKRDYGGLGLPHTIKAIAMELSYRADTSTTIAIGSINLAGILEKAASEEMKQKWIPKMIKERYSATMGLSEPDFGSDLPSVKTRAEKIDGKWYITGNKRYQTVACGINGDPGVTLCLARTGSPTSGAKGLSFFLVESKDIEITGLEHKLGLKASATCEVAYEKAEAHLIGKEGYGLVKYVISMLNGARMSVAAQGVGISEAAYREAMKYATERIQFGKPLVEIPVIKRMLRRMQVEIAAMRCLMLEGARSVDLYHWRQDHLAAEGQAEREVRNDEQVKFFERLANTLTPMSKYYNSEMCNSLVYDGLQVLGGAGFIEDYDLARLYRDARITNIYDGTTQIQINAAIGGIAAGMNESGVLYQYLYSFDQEFTPSTQAVEIRDQLGQMVELYKELGKEDKEAYSFELVETATRLVNGLLLERAASRVQSEDQQKRQALAREYTIESQAITQGNLVKLQALSQAPALA